MLRTALLVLGMVLMGVGIAAMGTHSLVHSGYRFLLWGTVLVLAILCERWRYRRIEHFHDERWQQTGERFEDPKTGQIVEVLFDPSSGERRYARVSKKTSPF